LRGRPYEGYAHLKDKSRFETSPCEEFYVFSALKEGDAGGEGVCGMVWIFYAFIRPL
jgi:hypothetical protein